MAKTLKFNVSFALTVGACTEVTSAFANIRHQTRKKVEKDGLELVMQKAEAGTKHLLKLYLDETVSDEQCLVETVRAGVRMQLEELRQDDKEGNFQRVGDINVVPRV